MFGFDILAGAITSLFFTAAGAMGATLATATLATVGTIVGYVGAALIYGGVALAASLATSAAKPDLGSQSPTYKGLLQTQTDQNLPVPLLYGTVKVAGNRIWQDENYQKTVKRIVAFSEGEITEYSEIKLNDIPIEEISGITVNRYYGTNSQTVDPIVGGNNQEERAEKVGSLKNIAYLAITVPRTQKIDMNYNLTAVVKGRKIRVYKNPYEYEIKYSENPAWILFDFLTCYNGLGLGINEYGNIDDAIVKEMFDLDSFIESAAFCDEIVKTPILDSNGKETGKYETNPRFTFNMIFDAQTSARTLLDEIYRSCRGGLFVKNGKLQFKIDKPEPLSKIFKENDIIKGSETFETIPKEEHYDILKCTFVSPKHEWQKVEATAEIPEYRDGVLIEHSVDILSCTSFNQASRLAWYYVNSKRLQPYFGSFQTDYKGYDLEVGDVISFDSILMGLKSYKVKVTSVTDNGAGVFTVNWRTYDERLYSDELGSKEPRVLVSNLSDPAKYPDDVQNFNVVQSNNLFNFVWQPNQNKSDTYEIRMGDSWENSALIQSKITESKFTIEIPTNGVFKFWIKAFNGYNYSKNPTLDVISIDSVPSVNEIVKINVLENIAGTLDENLRVYRDTIKLVEQDIKWLNTEDFWYSSSGYYQRTGIWGTDTSSGGVYLSQVYDIGAVLECIVAFDIQYTSADEQSTVLVEWALSDDGENFSDWKIVNTGKYTFRYCKFRVTLKAYNNVQTVLTTFNVAVDVPDKDLDLELEITDNNGLRIDYSFIRPPSIVATVNDNNDAYVVVTEKTNTYAILKAYTNAGELTTCKLSLRAKGY